MEIKTQEEGQVRPVNQLLGQPPSLGPIPGDQVIPWLVIAAISLGLRLFVGISWYWTGFIFVWGIFSWWILTGRRAWRFLNRFSRPPKWARGYKKYEFILEGRDGSEKDQG